MKQITGWAVGLVLMASTFAHAVELDALAADAVKQTCAQFAEQKLVEADVAVTVIDLRDQDKPRTGNFRGDENIYPASVIKLFYLAAAHRWLEDGKLFDSPELRRTMHDMIVDSNNDATTMILEALTDATNGAPLPPAEMKSWADKRNAVNRYYTSMGYTGVNACQKTYCEGPYGRDKLFLGEQSENRNHLTTNATARLLQEIVSRKAVTPGRSNQMLELLKRDPSNNARNPDSQDTGFSAMALPPKARLWAKAGWTNTARHDAAYIETEDGVKAIIVIFTTGHGRERKILPAITGRILRALHAKAS